MPEQVPGIVEDSYAELGLVGLTVAGDWDSGPAPEVWACSRAATWLVVEPLGMADSWFPAQARLSPDVACGYRLAQDGSFVPEPLPTFALQSAGGLWSTGPDLVRFGSGWRTLLPGELAEQALRPHAQQYDSAAEIGLGWLLQRPMDAAGHNGSGPGSSASLITRRARAAPALC